MLSIDEILCNNSNGFSKMRIFCSSAALYETETVALYKIVLTAFIEARNFICSLGRRLQIHYFDDFVYQTRSFTPDLGQHERLVLMRN